jgi:His/Glu/Gln/Arg/opine family amino acid ABC transporter permease subunit
VLTIMLTLIVITLSLGLAVPVALCRMSTNVAVRAPASVYVEVIRGTPLLLQHVYIYYVLPTMGINLSGFVAAVVGLTLNYTAYISEVYRGGILAVPRNQWEAAATVRLSRARTFQRIVLPQAFLIVTPTLGNYFISLFKDTALASVVTVQELTFTGQIVFGAFISIFYGLYGHGNSLPGRRLPCAVFVRWLEKRAQRGHRAERPA